MMVHFWYFIHHYGIEQVEDAQLETSKFNIQWCETLRTEYLGKNTWEWL